MTFAVIVIVAALSFFPALALGPIADYLDFLMQPVTDWTAQANYR